MYTDAKKNFDSLNAQGLLGKHYTHILAMIMRFVYQFHHLTLLNLIYIVCGVLSFIRVSCSLLMTSRRR